MNRRSFLRLGALAAGGLVLGLGAPGCGGDRYRKMTSLAAQTGQFQPHVLLTLTPEGEVIVAMNKVEMGQGIMTGHAMLIAEELEVPVSSVKPFHAPAEPEFRRSVGEGSIDTGGVIGMQITGGSSSTPESWIYVREIASVAREMLIQAAAAQWGVSAGACFAQDGAVIHRPSGRSLRYGALTRAAAQLPLAEPKLKDPSTFKVIGKPLVRVDARQKVDGSGVFGMDIDLPGMLKAYVLHPPEMGGQALRVDSQAAAGLPGVKHIKAFERGVAVVAEKLWQAQAAARALQIQWGPGVLDRLDTEEVRQAIAREALAGQGDAAREEGDTQEALEQEGATVVEALYEAPYLAHATMEPQNCTVHLQGDRVQLWCPNQSATLMAEAAARVLGVHRDQVTVHTTLIGGGFGRRTAPDFVAEAVMLARALDLKVPLQVIWSREEDTAQGHYRPISSTRMRGAVGPGAQLLALDYHSVSQPILADQTNFVAGFFADWIPLMLKRMALRANQSFINSGALPDMVAMEGAQDTPYTAQSVRVAWTPVRTRLPVAFWRSVGHSFNGFVMESFIDELAHAAQADPVAFREAHLKDKPDFLAVLREAARLGEWGSPLPEGVGRGVAIHKSFHSICAEVVEARVHRGQIQVLRVSCAVDCGRVINPDLVKAQIESAVVFGLSAALWQEITLEGGQVQQGNFDTYPVMRMHQCPQIEVSILDSQRKPSGVGEPGVPPIAPALANALFDATGVRLRRMPMQPAWDAQAAKEAP
jgi:CO/xanthine dehydrogenase Mo-binding subunit